ncbi:MAG TPA: NADH-quinone oxidoreductase subunit L [Acidimicrobiia bacterium]
MAESIWIVIAAPLAGAVLLHFFGRWLGEPGSGWLATLTVGVAFGFAFTAAIPFFQGTGEPQSVVLYSWMPAVGATFELLWDPLSALMALVVTGVGGLIHLFSIGYMHGDERFGRFFTYLNLFVASMLILVLADNFAVLFLGWELVGLCSYLLISFWFTRPAAAVAGKKAFVVNRIGDLGFVVAVMLIFASFGTLSFSDVFANAPDVLSAGGAAAIGVLLLLGAAGKSAQLPLHVWLPDAMEGPTPVSALIHAATMVTAGVYMIARVSPIYELAPTASAVVAIVGALTALFAATIAFTQTDIKRVLAFSTISQLGYMFMAVGVAGYVAGAFHLMTHAFFKGLLFLGAGSVMHALAGEQNMHRMGGLFRRMPVTALTMAVAALAIVGIPPLSGFWSKDDILAVVFGQGDWYYLLWALGILTATVTAFYMTRQYLLVFAGRPRWEEGAEPHESPLVMTAPLVVLAVLAFFGGLVNTPFSPGLEHFLEPSFEGVTVSHPSTGTLVPLAIVVLLAEAVGVAAAALVYLGPVAARVRLLGRVRGAWEAIRAGYHIDELYAAAVASPGEQAAVWAAFAFDARGVDGVVNGVARVVGRLGATVRPLQTGYVRNYALGIAVGATGLAVWLLARGL